MKLQHQREIIDIILCGHSYQEASNSNVDLSNIRLSVGASSSITDDEMPPPPLPTSLPPNEEKDLTATDHDKKDYRTSRKTVASADGRLSSK